MSSDVTRINVKEPTPQTRLAFSVGGGTDNAATVALLEQWAAADATDDPAAIAQAERELAEFKRALNANRPPDRPIFP